MHRLLLLTLLFVAQAAIAAPQQIKAVYHATRNGQPFATVTETYTRDGGKYKLESLTEGIGVYALFGKRRLYSEGEVAEGGLRPAHFEQQQGEPRKNISADFDWATNQLTMKYKGKTGNAQLETGTQDILSYAYQFMFKPPQGEEVAMPVTTGRKMRVYRYRVTAHDEAVTTEAGKFSAVHLVDAEPDDDQKEIWLGAEAHHLPVRITMTDENGVKTEQTLISLHVE